MYAPKAEVVARHPDFYFRSAKHSPGGIGILVPNPSDVNRYVLTFSAFRNIELHLVQSRLALPLGGPMKPFSHSCRTVIHRSY